jgi:hypothetical protein
MNEWNDVIPDRSYQSYASYRTRTSAYDIKKNSFNFSKNPYKPHIKTPASQPASQTPMFARSANRKPAIMTHHDHDSTHDDLIYTVFFT